MCSLSEWHMSDGWVTGKNVWVTSEWQVSDRWVTSEWRVSDRWVTGGLCDFWQLWWKKFRQTSCRSMVSPYVKRWRTEKFRTRIPKNVEPIWYQSGADRVHQGTVPWSQKSSLQGRLQIFKWDTCGRLWNPFFRSQTLGHGTIQTKCFSPVCDYSDCRGKQETSYATLFEVDWYDEENDRFENTMFSCGDLFSVLCVAIDSVGCETLVQFVRPVGKVVRPDTSSAKRKCDCDKQVE